MTLRAQKKVDQTLQNEFLTKVKDVATGVDMAGGVISRRMVNTTGMGVAKANCP